MSNLKIIIKHLETLVIIGILGMCSIYALQTSNTEIALVTLSALISYLAGRYHNKKRGD